MNADGGTTGSMFRTASLVPSYAQAFVTELIAEQTALEAGLTGETGEDSEEKIQKLERARRTLRRLDLLATDDRMTEAYAILNKEFSGEHREAQWYRFIVACIDADSDHSYERSVVEYGRHLRHEIQASAERLCDLLIELEEASGRFDDMEPNEELDWPHELFQMRLRRFVLSKEARRLGLSPREDAQKRRARRRGASFYRYSSVDILSPCEIHVMKRREFGVQPRLVVGEIARQARRWKPWPGRGGGAAEVVLKSQKRLPKAQLIRSFWYYLTWRRYNPWGMQWQRTIPLLKAIAVTCTVLIDSAEEVITYTDVKHSLKIFDPND